MTEQAEFVKFGTSLPDFKGEDEHGERSLSVRTKFNEPHQFKHDVRIADQVVTDAQGRRRFHGAFTGGYSAGYYNSVGSEQGWTPKNNLERKMGQTTDDFMDDEDKEEFGISPRGLAIKEAFKPGVSQKSRVGFPGMDPGSSLPKKVVSGYAHNLIPKTECTMGLRILRTMGFVEGNSTNLAHVDKMLAIQRKLILAKQKNDVEKSLQLLEEKLRIRGKVTSKTTEFVLPKSNNQNFGMGYKKLNQLYKKNTESTAVESKKSKFAISGGGFGVNCFEEEDDDIYAMDSMKNYDIDINIASARKPDRSNTVRLWRY